MDFLFILIVVVIAIVIIAMVKRNYDKGGKHEFPNFSGYSEELDTDTEYIEDDTYNGGSVVSGGITDF